MKGRASEGGAHWRDGHPVGAHPCAVRPPYGGSLYYAGLDLHKKYFTLCVLTSEGQVVCDHRRLPAEVEPLTTILRDLGGPAPVTVEATRNGPGCTIG